MIPFMVDNVHVFSIKSETIFFVLEIVFQFMPIHLRFSGD